MTKILIIDDDTQVLDTLKYRFEHDKFDVLTAANGLDGVQIATDELPELIVLDLAMPGIDGLEVMRQLRHNVVTWEIPVLVLSAQNDADVRTKSLELGARRYLSKPLSPRRLLAEVKRALALA